jgi:hypothetical protein
MNINFQCDNIIIVRYDGGNGGEFLMNCLSLSNDAVMQHHKIAEMQLHGLISYEHKVKILLHKIEKNKSSVWDDFSLGSIMSNEYRTFINSEEIYKLNFYPIMYRLTNKKEKYFFIKVHRYVELCNILKVFKNAKVIDFMNNGLFAAIRNNNNNNSFFAFLFWQVIENPKIYPKLYNKWKNYTNHPDPYKKYFIKLAYNELLELLENKNLMDNLHKVHKEGMLSNIWDYTKCPNLPKYIKEYAKLDIKLRNEIQNNFYSNQENINQDLYKNNVVYTWNSDWYFSLEDTLKGFKELYEILGLDNYDETSLSLLYNSWIDKIDEMKKFQLLK